MGAEDADFWHLKARTTNVYSGTVQRDGSPAFSSSGDPSLESARSGVDYIGSTGGRPEGSSTDMKQSAILTIIVFAVSAEVLAQTQTYCSDFAGNIACTSYGGDGSSSQSYCTSIGGSLSCTTYDNDNYSRVRIERNYEAGQVIGTALGNVVVAAIKQHTERKKARQQWEQYVQDKIAVAELACETDPDMGGTYGAVGCRTAFFAFNSFLHKHRKDFPLTTRNLDLLRDATAKMPGLPDDLTLITEQMIEKVFQTMDKKQLDR